MEKGAANLNVLLRVVSTRSCHLSKDLKEASLSFGNVVGGVASRQREQPVKRPQGTMCSRNNQKPGSWSSQ